MILSAVGLVEVPTQILAMEALEMDISNKALGCKQVDAGRLLKEFRVTIECTTLIGHIMVYGVNTRGKQET